MKKVVISCSFAALLASGCGEDKKAVIPTNLSQPTPIAASASGGGGGGQKAGNTTGGGKVKSPGGESKAD